MGINRILARALGSAALLALATGANAQAEPPVPSSAPPLAQVPPDAAAAQGAPVAAETPPANSGGVEEIVVTAQRRAENLQRTPIAITALSSTAPRRRASPA